MVSKTFREVLSQVLFLILVIFFAGSFLFLGVVSAGIYANSRQEIASSTQAAALFIRTYISQRHKSLLQVGKFIEKEDPLLVHIQDQRWLHSWIFLTEDFSKILILDKHKKVHQLWENGEENVTSQADLFPSFNDRTSDRSFDWVMLNKNQPALIQHFSFGWIVAFMDLTFLRQELKDWSQAFGGNIRLTNFRGENLVEANTSKGDAPFVVSSPIKIKDLPLNLIGEKTWTRLLPALLPFGVVLLIFLAGLTVLLLGIHHLWARRVLTALDAFQRETRKVASGDYSVALEYTPYEDLNSILKEFETLREKIWMKEQDLRDSEYRFRRMFEDAQIGIMHTTIEGKVLDMNQSMASILGFETPLEAVEYYTSADRLFFHPEERKGLVHQLQSDPQGKIRVKTEFVTQENQKTISVSLYLSRVFDPQRSEFIIETFCEDISEILKAEQAILELNQDLERKVAERTQHLELALSDLRTAQEHLVQSEKLAALGQLIAGIAHEINTPLGAISASNENILSLLKKVLENLPWLMQVLTLEQRASFYQLYELGSRDIVLVSSAELRQKRKNLSLFLEKHGITTDPDLIDNLADLGIEGELEKFLPLLKDPLGQDAVRMINEMLSMERSCSIINEASDKAEKVVLALKTFSHQDQSESFQSLRLQDGLETVLTLFQNKIKLGVEVIRRYEFNEPIMGYPDKLNQVWTNLISNALQAMEYKGTLEVVVRKEDPYVLVAIIDSGKGIPPEIQDKIFEPFYTTKKPGEGSGLGLDISRTIVLEHKGRISFESVPGRTVFSVHLPGLD
jgi:PAS domain S-box-containing protein